MISIKHSIRVAQLEDLPALLRLQEIFETDRLTRRALAASLRSSSQLVLIVERERDVCGSAITFLRRRSRSARLYDLSVATQTRRIGLGTALLRAVERKAKNIGATSIHLEVHTGNAAAYAFYRDNGYDVFGRYERYYQDGCAALRMRKLLRLHLNTEICPFTLQ